jgi:hypothetical protein
VQSVQQAASKSSLAFLPSGKLWGRGGPRTGRPRPFAEDRGLSAEWGEGWGLGARPPGARPFNAARPLRFLPGILFEPATPRRTSAAMHCQPIGLVTLPGAGTPL